MPGPWNPDDGGALDTPAVYMTVWPPTGAEPGVGTTQSVVACSAPATYWEHRSWRLVSESTKLPCTAISPRSAIVPVNTAYGGRGIAAVTCGRGPGPAHAHASTPTHTAMTFILRPW